MNFEKAKAILNKKSITYSEAMDIFSFVFALIEHHERGLVIGETCLLLNQKMQDANLVSGLDAIVLDLLVVKGYMQTDYPWRARSYAKKAYDALVLYYETNKPDENTTDFFDTLGGYFSGLSARKEAIKCYEQYQKYAVDTDEKLDSFYQLLVCHKRLDENYMPPYTEEEVQKLFPKGYEKIISAMHNKGYLRCDPIENTEEFQRVFDEVHEEAQKLMDENGGFVICQQYWQALEDLYLEKGIEWKNPGIMNPGTMFD